MHCSKPPMRRRLMPIVAIFSALVFAPLTSAAPVIDQRDPAYQRMMDQLDMARDALTESRRALRAAEANNVLPGFRIDQIRSDVKALQHKLEQYLVPRERRHRYQRLQPDGAYFNPDNSEQ